MMDQAHQRKTWCQSCITDTFEASERCSPKRRPSFVYQSTVQISTEDKKMHVLTTLRDQNEHPSI